MIMTAGRADDIAALSFEAALEELDTLIAKLEGGSVALDDAIAAYERATALARHCEAVLDRTERRVNALVVGGDGRLAEAPLDVDDRAAPQAGAPTPGPALFAEDTPRARRPRIDPDDIPF